MKKPIGIWAMGNLFGFLFFIILINNICLEKVLKDVLGEYVNYCVGVIFWGNNCRFVCQKRVPSNNILNVVPLYKVIAFIKNNIGLCISKVTFTGIG
jgi:hypothetical protein